MSSWVDSTRTENSAGSPNIITVQISGEKLDKKDTFGKGDPFLRIFSNGILVYRSEVVRNNNNPSFKPFELAMSRVGGPNAIVNIECYDFDKDGGHDLIGTCDVEVRKLGEKGFSMELHNYTKKTGGLLKKTTSLAGVLHVTNASLSFAPPTPPPQAYLLECYGTNLEAKDGVGKKSDPFLVFIKDDGRRQTVIAKTEFIRQTLNPEWKPFAISTFDAALEDTITVKCYDWDEDGSHDLIGMFSCQVQELLYSDVVYPLVNPDKKRPMYKNSGLFYVRNCKPTTPPFTVLPAAYSIKCSALKLPTSLIGKTDPFFKVFSLGDNPNSRTLVYKSPVVKNNRNPSWPPMELSISAFGGKIDSDIVVEVWDWEQKGNHSELGQTKINLREMLLPTPYFSLTDQSKSTGSFFVESVTPLSADQLKPPPLAFHLKCSASKLDRMDGPLSKSDPFFEIRTQPEDLIYRSEYVRQELSPSWSPFTLALQSVGGIDGKMVVRCIDWDATGEHDIIGNATVSMRELVFGEMQVGLINAEKLDKMGYKSSGSFSFDQVDPIYDPKAVVLNTFPIAPAYKFTVSAAKIQKRGLTTTPAPYFEVLVPIANVDPFFLPYKDLCLYRSEILKGSSAEWAPFVLNLQDIVGAGQPSPATFFTITVYDWSEKGHHKVVGSHVFTFHEMSFKNLTVALGEGDESGGGFTILAIEPLGAPMVPQWMQAHTHAPPALRLKFSGVHLDALDLLGKSDPFFDVTVLGENRKPIKLYRSEVIKSTLNPDWHAFELPWQPIGGLDSPIKVSVYDWDKTGGHDIIGVSILTLRLLLMGHFIHALYKPSSTKSGGGLSVTECQPLEFFESPFAKLAPAYLVKFSACKLDAKDLLGSDPFFDVVCKPPGYTQQIKLYRSEVIKKNCNPSWAPFELPTSGVGGLDAEFTINCYDWDADGSHDLIGKVTTTLRDFTFGPFDVALLNPEKMGKSGYESSGALSTEEFAPLPAETIKPLYPVYECHCSATKIEKMDGGPLGKADPFFEVLVTPPGQTVPVKVYRSEVCKKTLSPKWNPFRIDVELYGGFDRFMKIDCYDWDPDGVHDLIGSLETTLREFTFGPTQMALRNPSKIHDSSYQSSGGFSFDKFIPLPVAIYNIPPALAFMLTVSGSKIKSDDLIRKADPFFEIFAKGPAGKPVKVYRSEVLKQHQNPEWAPFVLPVADVGGLDSDFTIKCWDWDKDGGHDFVGETHCRLREWLIGAITLPLYSGSKSGGGFTVSAMEPMAYVPQKQPLAPAYNIFCSAMKLEAKDSGINAKSDPFFDVSVTSPGQSKPCKLYRSEVVMKDLNPTWKAFQLCTADVGGLDGEFTISCYDWDRDGTHDLIGRSVVNIRELLLGPVQLALRDPERESHERAPIVTHDGKELKGYQSSGAFSIDGIVALPSAAPKAPVAPAYLVKCSAKKLARKDGPLAKSDPYFEVICQPPGYHQPIKLYRSEVIKQNLNPDWEPFELSTYSVGSIDTFFTINCFDWDKDGSHDLIGSLHTTLREFTFGPVQMPLVDPDMVGKHGYESSGGFGVDEFIPLAAETARPIAPAYRVYPSAMKLDKKDPGPTGKSDPFFIISVQYPGGYSAKIYRSEVVMKDLNPKWKPFEINLEDVGGMDGLFTVECYDWDADGSHDLIGTVTTTFREFTFGSVQLALIDPEKAGRSGYHSSGAFSVDQIEPLAYPIVRPFFPAYKLITGGTKLAKRSLMGKSSAFFEVFALINGAHVRLYRSETITENDAPNWAPVDVSVAELGGFDSPFAIKCFNWDKAGDHFYVGESIITLRECLLGNFTAPLLNGKDSKGGFTIYSCYPEPYPPQRPPPANAYEIHCSAMNLDSKNGPLQKSDPYFEISTHPPGFENPIKLYRSSVIKQTLNPKWEPFSVSVAELGGLDFPFTIDCYDWEKDGANQLIGSLSTTLREFMFGPVQIALINSGKSGKSAGAFSVDLFLPLMYAPLRPPIAPAYFVVCFAQKLTRKELLGKTDAFFEVLCHPPGYSAPIKLHRSEVVQDSLSPSWAGFQLSTAAVGGLDTEFTINCMHWDKDGGHQFIGCARTTLREFTLGPLQLPLLSKEESAKNKKGHKNSEGAFCVETFQPLAIDELKPIAPAYRITASGIKLEKKDGLFGKSDPFFVVSSPSSGKLHRSESVKQDLNPKWRPFNINLREVGGMDTPFTISCYDWDADGVHDLIGEVVTTFREFTFGSFQFALINPKKLSTLGYRSSGGFSVDLVEPLAFEVSHPLAPAYRLHCVASKLDRKDVLGKSDGYFEVYSAALVGGKPLKLYRSEVIKQELSPDWQPFEISLTDTGGIDSPLTIKCFDWDESGAHDYIGTLQVTLRECLFGNLTIPLINANKLNRIGYKSSGGFSIQQCDPIAQPPQRPLPAPGYALSFSAAKVDKKNLVATSADPYFEISVARPNMSDRPIKLYRSPVLRDTVNPEWGPFSLCTEEVGGFDGEFTLTCFDWEKDGAHVEIGRFTTTLREFTFGPFQFPLINIEKAGRFGYSSSGTLSIYGFAPLLGAPRTIPIAPAYWVKCSARKVDSKDLLGKSDPFFEVVVQPPGSQRSIKLYRSEVITKNTDPSWSGFQLPTAPIGGWDTLFTVRCFDWDANGAHQLIGECKISLRELSLGSVQLALINPDKQGRIGYTSSGGFSFDEFQPLAEHSINPIAPAYTLHVSGQKLEKKDGPLGASDPFFVVSRNGVKLYRSEAVKQNLNPTWLPFNVNIQDLGGIDEPFVIDCFDWDADGVHSLIGSLTTTFREFTFGAVQIALLNPRKVGRIGYHSSGAFSVDQIVPLSQALIPVVAPAYRLLCSGSKLPMKDLTLKADPFFEISVASATNANKSIKIYRSEVVKQTLAPEWFPVDLAVDSQLGGIDKPFVVKFYDWDSDGGHDYIGSVTLTLRECRLGNLTVPIINEAKASRIGYTSSGGFSISHCNPIFDPPQKRPVAPAYLLYCSSAKLEAKDGVINKSSDPFIEVTVKPDGYPFPIKLYKSAPQTKTLSPTWEPFALSLTDVGGIDGEITVTCYDWDKDGAHNLIGTVTTNMREFSLGPVTLALVNPAKVGRPMYQSSGAFSVDKFSPLEVPPPNFMLAPAYKLRCSGEKLERKDGPLAKSDPFFEITAKPPGYTRAITLHRSPVIKQTLSPEWPTFELPTYLFGTLDTLFTITCFDWDADGGHDLIGQCTTTLREFTFGPTRLALVNPSKVGRLGYKSSGGFSVDEFTPVPLQDVQPTPPAFRLTTGGKKLDGKSVLGKSDPFFVLSRVEQNGTLTKVYRSEAVKQDLNPNWKPFEVNLCDLGGLDGNISVECYDWNGDGLHELIGSVTTTFREFTFGSFRFGLTNPKKVGRVGYQTSGAFSVEQVEGIWQEIMKPLAPGYVLECRGSKLAIKDLSLKSDPYFEIISLRETKTRKLYRSEVIKENLNPAWKPFSVIVDEIGGIDKPFLIKCFDWDANGGHDFIGSVQTTLRECLFGSLTIPLRNENQVAGGFSVVTCKPVYQAPCRPFIAPSYQLHCSGKKLDAKDGLLGKSDPFFEITVKLTGAQRPIKLHRSSVQKETLEPIWEPCDISVYDVGGIDGEFTINCYDYNKNGAHLLIGSVTTTLWEFSLGPVQLALINPAKVGRPLYDSSGAFSIDQLIPLPDALQKPVCAPAYNVKCSAFSLDRKDGLLGESDPFFEILCQPPGYSQEIKLFRSEVIKKNLNPEWAPFELSAQAVGGFDTLITINCYDWDKDGGHDLIGSLTTTLRDFTFGPMAVALVNPAKVGRPGYRSSGAFYVDYFVPIPNGILKTTLSPSYKINVSGVKLEAKDLLGKSDPFFVVRTKNTPLYRSEPVKQNLNPVWNPFEINILDIGGLDSLFDIDCYDWDADGVHDYIGKVTTTFREFTFGPFDFGLINKNKQGRIGYTTSGALHVEIVPIPQLPIKWSAPGYKLHCNATKLASRDILTRKLDPFFEVFVGSRKIYRSEIVKQSVDPEWKPFDLGVADLGGLDQILTIKCFDWDKNENKDYVGSMETSLRECTLGSITIPLRSSASGSSCGGFTINKCVPLDAPPATIQFAPAYDIRCKANLPGKVVGSTNAFFEIVVKSSNIKVYRSPVLKDTKEPLWDAPCILRIGDTGGMDGEITFHCYDYDKDGSHSLIGSHTTTLRDFTFGLPAKLPLVNQEKVGSFGYINSGSLSIIALTPLPTAPQTAPLPPAFEVKCSAQKLDSKDTLGKSDPYFEILYHPQGYPAPLKLHRSEVVAKELNPTWVPFQISTAALNGLDVPFTVNCFDWDKDGSHDLIGSLRTTLRELSLGPVLLPLINPDKVGRLGYHSSGGFYFEYTNPLPQDKVLILAPAYQFHFSAQKLDRKDGPLAKSDPFFVIKKTYPGYTEPSTLYRSEYVKQSLTPTWNPVSLNTSALGIDEPFNVEVYDWDKDGIHELIGKLTTTLREFTFGSVQLGLINPEKIGRLGYQSSGAFSLDGITPLAEPVVKSLAPAYALHCSAAGLDRKDALGKSDPYFEIAIAHEGIRPVILYRSEHVDKSLSPEWQPAEIALLDIGNPYFPLTVSVYDFDKDGSHDLIGECVLTLDECVMGNLTLPVINHSKKGKLGYTSSGSFTISQALPIAATTKPALAPAYQVTCAAINLDNKDRALVGTSDPFFEITAFNGFKVYQSETVKNNSSPAWSPFPVDIQVMGGLDAILKVTCFDRDRSSSDELIGHFETTLRDILVGNFSAALKNPYKKRIGYTSSGGFNIFLAPIYQPIPLPPLNAFAVTFDFDWPKKKRTVSPIRIESRPPGSSEFVLVAYAPPTTSTATIRLEDVKTPYEPIRLIVSGYNPLDTTVHELRFPVPTFHLITSVKGKHKGLLKVIKCENISSPATPVFSISCSAVNLDAMDGLGEKSDPFLIFKSPLGVVLHNTEVVPQTLSPTWKPFVIDIRQSGLLADHPLLIECWDFDPDGGHDLIGTLTASLREIMLMQHEGATAFSLINLFKKQKLPRYTNSGQLLFNIQFV